MSINLGCRRLWRFGMAVLSQCLLFSAVSKGQTSQLLKSFADASFGIQAVAGIAGLAGCRVAIIVDPLILGEATKRLVTLSEVGIFISANDAEKHPHVEVRGGCGCRNRLGIISMKSRLLAA